MTAIFFLLLLFAMAALSWLPFALSLFYFVLSAITFFTYGLDKFLAVKEKTRISEKTLHLFALIGGWPGAYVGQQVFRHKISKQKFRHIFWLTMIVNVFVLVVFLIVKYQQGIIVLDF
jgi:uncharacterized membrane protein YsdA (DUF1294 family)